MNPTLTAIASAAPAIAMLGVFACLIGGGAMIAAAGRYEEGRAAARDGHGVAE